MPLVKIEMYAGKSREYQKAVLDGIHEALVEAFGIPESDRIQRIYELDEDDFERGEGKTTCLTLIEITIFKGRSREAKKRLYEEISRRLKNHPGIESSDLVIVLNEPEMINWGIRGLPADEVHLGFKIDV